MFVIDPKKRPSAEECLRHEFMQINIAVVGKGFSEEGEAGRQESKSTEKTYGSNISQENGKTFQKYSSSL